MKVELANKLECCILTNDDEETLTPLLKEHLKLNEESNYIGRASR